MRKHSSLRRVLSLVMAVALCLSLLPRVASAADEETFSKITSEAEFTSGQYVMVVDNGYAPGVLDGSWITAAQPAVADDVVTDTAGAVWTLTVEGTTVKLTDGNGVSVAPKGGNENGIKSGDYSWSWSFEGGKFTFAGQGADTVVLASNVGSQNKFRAYKTSTVSGNPNGYPNAFTLYKLGGTGTEPPAVDITDKTPSVTGTVAPGEALTFQLPGVTEEVIWQVSGDGESWTAVSNPYTVPDAEPGEYTLHVRAALGEQLSQVLVLTYTVEEAPAEGTVWTKVELADIKDTDTIAITMTKGDTTWVLPNVGEGSKGQPLASYTGTVAGDTLTTDAAEIYSWTFTATDGGYHITAGSDYLYSINDNNGVRIGGTAAVWSIQENYLSTSDTGGNTRYLGVYNSQDWRAYKNTTGNTAGQTLGFWKLGGGEETPDPAAPAVADGVYVIWEATQGKAASALAESYTYGYLKPVDVALTGGTLTGYGETEAFTITNVGEDNFTIRDSYGRYLYMSGTYNSFNVSAAEPGSGHLWTAVKNEDGTVKLMNVEKSKYVSYDTGYSSFGAYAAPSDAQLDDLTLTPYVEPAEEEKPVIESGEYVIWDTVNMKALSSVRSYEGSYYYNGVDVTETNGVLSGYGETEIWTVTVTDGKLTITCGEEKLGMSGSYGSISNADGSTDWELEDAGNGACYVKNTVTGKYIKYDTSYGTWSSSTSVSGASVLKFTPPAEVTEPITGVADGDYVIWAPAYNMALSTTYSGFYNSGVELTVEGDKIYGYEMSEIWTVTNNDDGTITISCPGGKLAMDTGYSSMPLNAVNDTWVLEDAGNGLWYVKNVGRSCYIEWYAANKYWSGYAYINSGSEGMFALKFTPVDKSYETDTDVVKDIAQWAGGYSEGLEQLLYADGDKYVMGDHLDTDAKLTIMANGSIISPYYKPGDNWYMGGNNVGAKPGDYVQLAFSAAGWGNMELSFRLRATNAGPGSFQVQYSTDGGSTFHNFTTGSYSYSYTGWNSEGSYPVTGEGDIIDGIARTSLAPGQYVSFTFDVPGGAENCKDLLIRLVPGTDRANGAEGAVAGNIRMDSVVVSGSPIVDDGITGHVTVTPNGEDEDQAVGTELTMTSATEGATIYYRFDGGQWNVYDPENKPTLDTLPCNLEVYAASEGKADSVTLLYHYAAGTVENVKFTPNGGGVYITGDSAEITLSCKTDGATIWYATSADGVTFTDYAVYTSPIVVNKGFEKLVVKAYAEKEGYNTSAEVTRTFTERETSTYSIYFGQLHSHSNISDGSGSVYEAFQHAVGVKGLDFLAVTDHSNSFDGEGSGVLSQDGTTISTEWKEGHEAAASVTGEDFVGLYGFEMTWSNGLGHLNTFNTPGWQSRTQSAYTSFATALPNYYETLKTVPGSISQFNHPGTTFGDFSDFAHYDEEIDSLITLIEVGNGEGAIGSSGYFPSYEYYTRALDKGWHVAPTNNQDNHKGLWGDANTGRSVILADDLSEESIYDALRNYRVYATEDNDLEIYYTLDGNIMGSILDSSDVGQTLTLVVDLSDTTDSANGTVEVIVNGGLSIAKSTAAGEETVTFSVPADYNYYYIKVTQPDGDIAVTAPVWVGTVEAIGISTLEAGSQLTIAGEEQTFTMELFNNEKKALDVTSVVFTNKATGEVIYTDTTITSVPKLGTASCSFGYTFATDGIYTITATVQGVYDGVEKTYTKDLELTVMPKAITSNVIVDGTHYNDYVTGYYGGNTGNMTTIAAAQGIKVHVETEKITAEMLEDCGLLIISAPAKKTGTANAGDYVASSFEDEFIALVADYVKAGGNVVVCGLADYQDKGATNGAEGHTAAQINKLLEAIGSTMSVNDDEAYDEVSNGGQAYRLYPENFNTESQWTKGILEGQTYSQYSGCTVNVGEGTWLVKGFDTTYSIDSDGDGLGGVEMGEAVFLAVEETTYGGNIFVAGGVFVSDFEVKAELDNIWDLPYANRTIYENILNLTRTQPEITPIADVRKAELGRIFVIEGYVTAGTANPNTTFFDAIYVQDETGGITVFPYSVPGLELGTKLRITGYTDAYQGDKEIQILTYQILDGEPKVIDPEKLGNKDAMDYETNGGELIQVEGEVVEVLLTSDGKGVAQFVVKDANGDLAKVFIDGYILSGTTGENTLADIVKVGNTVSAVGLLYLHPEGDSEESVAVLRVRDCDEVKLLKEAEPVDPEDPTDPGDPSDPVVPGEPVPSDPAEPGVPGDPSNPPGGDDAHIAAMVSLMLICLVAVAVLVIGRKKWSAE